MTLELKPRVDRWESKLVEFIESRRSSPFEWGPNDCVTFAMAAVEVVTGAPVDVTVTWTSEEEAVAALEAGGGLIEVTTGVLGAPLDSPKMMQRGDVCVIRWSVDGEEVPGLGVCVGLHIVGPGVDSIRFAMRSAAVVAWPVGRVR